MAPAAGRASGSGFLDIPGVTDVSLAMRTRGQARRHGSRQLGFDLLAVEPERFHGLSWWRDDFASQSSGRSDEDSSAAGRDRTLSCCRRRQPPSACGSSRSGATRTFSCGSSSRTPGRSSAHSRSVELDLSRAGTGLIVDIPSSLRPPHPASSQCRYGSPDSARPARPVKIVLDDLHCNRHRRRDGAAGRLRREARVAPDSHVRRVHGCRREDRRRL